MLYVKIVILILCCFCFSSFSRGENKKIIFSKNGSVLKNLSINSLKNLQTEEVLTVFEPLENLQEKYRGFSVLSLIEKIYGKNLNSSLDTLVFYCVDGYRADIPIEMFKRKKATISFAKEDGRPFVLVAKHSIPLGPLYLTWDHPRGESINKELFRWPYGIFKIDLIESSLAYKDLRPQNQIDKDLNTGYQEFLKHCFSCHTLNGVGGMRGPPLNFFLQTKSTKDLKSYILHPQEINKTSQMSGLPITLQDREKIAMDIVRYLQSQGK